MPLPLAELSAAFASLRRSISHSPLKHLKPPARGITDLTK